MALDGTRAIVEVQLLHRTEAHGSANVVVSRELCEYGSDNGRRDDEDGEYAHFDCNLRYIEIWNKQKCILYRR